MNPKPTTKSISTEALFQPLHLPRGPVIKNRLALAPLTNTQSNPDGTLSEDEYHFLCLRARGGFGWVNTCASHVQANGQGFPGQLGCFDDVHLPGLQRLATGLRAEGTVSAVQLQHSGLRAHESVRDVVAPSAHPESGARALSEDEIGEVIEAFITAALRAEKAGFDGVQIHGAHGYLIAQFLSPDTNTRSDRWGGSLENRSRLLFAIIEGIRSRCGANFQVGVRLSPERFGLRLPEMIALSAQLLQDERLDYLDVSLWDIFKQPEDPAYQGKTLLSLFTDLPRGSIKLGVAGKILSAKDALQALDGGTDYVALGRAAMLSHDYPLQVQADAHYLPPALPVSQAYLKKEGLGPSFLTYLSHRFPGFIAD